MHTFNDATCTTPKTCSECGETRGSALGHIWRDATCTVPKTCSRCGTTDGEALGHIDDGNGNCSRCGASTMINISKKIETYGFEYNLGYPYKDKINWSVSNASGQKIKYLICRLEFINSVGDLIYDSSTNLPYAEYKITGPFNSRNHAFILFSQSDLPLSIIEYLRLELYCEVKLSYIKVIYMDNSTECGTEDKQTTFFYHPSY